MNLLMNLVNNIRERNKTWLARCDWCSWPLHEFTEHGCVFDNCSMRPLPARECRRQPVDDSMVRRPTST